MAASSVADHRFSIFLQEACLRHQYIRSKDTSTVVEHPGRLRAVNVGIAAALARLESVRHNDNAQVKQEPGPSTKSPDDDLAAALGKLDISSQANSGFSSASTSSVIVKSNAKVNLLNNAAVKFIHGDIEGDVYLENLIGWAKESRDNIAKNGSEIPSNMSQGDLYLCPASIEAIQGAIGTTCEAVDAVITASRSSTSHDPKRAFVSVRPPGHHCGEDTPDGFCFVNNVAVAAAHAHLNRGINRVVIFDIDLHHGNGTQSIIWQINEETYRNTLEAEAGSASAKPGPQIYYGSIHDILSFPCEDGKPGLVQAASTSIHGPHGQFIENIHLQPYQSDEQFFKEHYAHRYSGLITKAEEFLDRTGGPGDDVLVFISCGFDACEHEYQSMQRHDRRVPTSFFHRFTRDAVSFANKYARGRLVSVLEGGYSDRALTSGAMAHILGLSDVREEDVKEEWWSLDNLVQLEQATKKRRGGRLSHTQGQPTISPPEWLQRTLAIFSTIDSSPPAAKPVVPASSMSLRERKPPSSSSSLSNVTDKPTSSKSGLAKSKPKGRLEKEKENVGASDEQLSGSGASSESLSSLSSLDGEGVKPSGEGPTMTIEQPVKKLPRVILRLGPKEGSQTQS